MTKEATMTFQVEAELQANFYSAAEADHRPAVQVLRELMSNYVQQVRNRTAYISPEERERREEAFKYARASVGLEGFKLSEAAEQHALRYINGEISIEELVKGYRHER